MFADTRVLKTKFSETRVLKKKHKRFYVEQKYCYIEVSFERKS